MITRRSLMVVLMGVAFLAGPFQLAVAKDTGITADTTLGGYVGTQPLTEPIKKQLDMSATVWDKDGMRRVLSQLKDGDILVLSVHSDPSVFGLGGKKVHWGKFWKYFGINKPPELGAVVIGGCMSREFMHQGEKQYVHINPLEIKFIREHLNTKALFLPVGEIHKNVAINDMNNLLKSIYRDKVLSKINLQGRWHYVAAPHMDRDSISLTDLRKKTAGGLCYSGRGSVGKSCCEGHSFKCKIRGQWYQYQGSSIDKNLDWFCDVCRQPFMVNSRDYVRPKGSAMRGDYHCKLPEGEGQQTVDEIVQEFLNPEF